MLGVEFTISDATGNVRDVVEFSEEAPVSGDAVADHVAAMSVLVGRAFASLAERLKSR
jgi:hypothetical protein